MKQKAIYEQKKPSSQLISSVGVVTPVTMPGLAKENSGRIKELRKPRSRKYVQASMELQEMLIQLVKLREEDRSIDKCNQLGTNSCNCNIESMASHDGEVEDYIQSVTRDTNRNVTTHTEEKTKEIETWGNTEEKEGSIKKDTITQNEKNKEIEDLEKQIEVKLDLMAKECPIINERLDVLYDLTLESYLISCGLIQGFGRPVYSRNDMADTGYVEDKTITEHLKRGYDIFMEYRGTSNFLCLEIYRDAYCLIYRDGIVKTVL